MSYEQQINVWFEQFDHRMHVDIPNIIAETATEFFQDRFKTQEWDKIPWQPLQPKYAAKKGRGRGRILTASGRLQRSIRPSIVKPNQVRISAGNSRVPYAKIHNEGLRVKGLVKVKAHPTRNFMGKGKTVQIKAHSRNVDFTMPQRQFMGHSKYLNAVLIDKLTKHFNS